MFEGLELACHVVNKVHFELEKNEASGHVSCHIWMVMHNVESRIATKALTWGQLILDSMLYMTIQ